MDKLKQITQAVWITAGVAVIIATIWLIPIAIDLQHTVSDMRQLWSQVTIEDMRNTIRVVEKQLDLDILELEMRKK
ncbi:MAG: hypothetical protein WC364_15540 [Eubacteriales bacterium]|jgi:ABC-type sulfate transport system permease component